MNIGETTELLDQEARLLHFAECESRLLLCPSCSSDALRFDEPVAYSWAHRLFCIDCDDNWLVCRFCKGKRQRLHLKVAKAINRHHVYCRKNQIVNEGGMEEEHKVLEMQLPPNVKINEKRDEHHTDNSTSGEVGSFADGSFDVEEGDVGKSHESLSSDGHVSIRYLYSGNCLSSFTLPISYIITIPFR
jgi:hypothetical protein